MRSQTDRGLPPDEELRKLAEAYLSCQRKHWPDLVKAGLLPEPSAAALDEMVADFKHRHRTGKINHQELRKFAGRCKAVGGNYCRFSCDNSEPKSIIDQMIESLEKARDEEHFVPWAYVHADYSVSGLDSERLGYSAYKDAMSARDTLIKTTYIADFTRASRDEIEWWKLAALSKKLNKGLVGAEDGFVRKIEDEDDDSLSQGYHTRVKQLQGELNDLRRDVREAETANVVPPPPLDIKAISGYLADLRGILTQDVAMAAEGLRALTGPITITQEKVPGRNRGGRWIATFSPDLIHLLAKIAKEKECPDSITLEYLSQRKWTTPLKLVVPIERVPRYEILAAEFGKQFAKGVSVSSLARDFNMTRKEAQQIVNFALHGERPKYGGREPVKRSHEKSTGQLPKYKLIADDVVHERRATCFLYQDPRLAQAAARN